MFRTFSRSEKGVDHRANEDAFVLRPIPNGILCVLADGQGGRAGGQRAASLACSSCLDFVLNSSAKALLDSATWNALAQHIDHAVAADKEAGFTTFVAFAVVGVKLHGASNGDSAAVLLGESRILTDGQPKKPPVGSGDAMFRLFAAELTPSSIVAALTDGAWKYGGWPNILNLDPTRGVEELVSTIVAQAKMQHGGWQDDCTVVAIQPTTEC